MGVYNMEKLFTPASIAVVGASAAEGSIGHALVGNLAGGGFAGGLYPVNPNHDTILGRVCYPSLAAIPDAVDLAVIALPMPRVPETVAQCVSRGVKAAVIVSNGGKESGDQGRALEAKIREIAYAGKLRIVGPNCLGVICPSARLNASFSGGMPLQGHIAFVSQSGALCTSILDKARQEGIGFSHFVSVGGMLDVDFGDMIDYLGNRSRVNSILLYIEHVSDMRKFMSAARAVCRVKPVVVLKAGRSRAGARAAASHTGAMTGEDAVYDAAFARAGIVRVDTIAELFDCAGLLAARPRPAGPRLAIITNGGGPGVMAADALAARGIPPAPLSPEIVAQLDPVLNAHWSRRNPIDMIGDATAERFRKTIEICIDSRGFDGILLIFCPQALTDAGEVAEAAVAALGKRRFPLLASWMGGGSVSRGVETLRAAGIPTYETPERAVQAFLHMVAYQRHHEMLMEIPPRLSRHITVDTDGARRLVQDGLTASGEFLTEVAAKAILSAYGLPVNRTVRAGDAATVLRLCDEIGYPVAMKIDCPSVTHKSDVGGVWLDIRDGEAARRAFDGIMAAAPEADRTAGKAAASVQAFVGQGDAELLIGARRDAHFGPVMVFGLGGVHAEIIGERNIGLPPLNRLLARRLMEGTRAAELLNGYRNTVPADMEMMEALLIRLSQLLVDFPEIVELDMNPVLLKGGRPLIVDARIRLQPAQETGAAHLIISPYPAHHAYHDHTPDGMAVFIRPIKPEDADLFVQLFGLLSPTSIYYRFFSALKVISPPMLARFTQIDYDREIALVALERNQEAERMLGVGRVISDPDGLHAEFSVLVGDPWQGRGIGALLLQRCLEIARERGIRHIWGTVLRENRNMIKLGKRLGFSVTPGEDGAEYYLRINPGDGSEQ